MAKPSDIDFQPYLNAIATTYEKWWQLYTLTDAEGKQRQSKEVAPIFDFGLMVQTVKKEEREQRQEEKIERFSVLEGLRKYAEQQVLLVGRPGSGKSTALARLLLKEAAPLAPQVWGEPSQIAAQSPPELGDLGGKIPVLVELRYWQGSIAQLILNSFTRHGLALKEEQLETVLPQLLILFDGVNELPSEEARSQLSAFRRNYPKLPMIFTTRDLSLGGDLGIEHKLEMQPLTEAQMQAFIRAYVPEQAEAMLRQLRDRLREFGQTPLLLWMLCEVFQQTPNNQLPSNLAGVFQAFTAMYEISSVRKHEVALLKGDVKPLSDRRLWKKALKALASVMMQGETAVDFRVVIHRDEAERELSRIFLTEQFPVRDILDDLLKYHLLQNRSVDQIEFRHQLIQEYYAAEALLERLPRLSDAVLKQEYLNYLKWTEPIALMLALVDDARAVWLVQLALDVDLMLGSRLAGEVQPVVLQKEAVTSVIKEIRKQQVSPTYEIQLLGNTHSDYAVPILLEKLTDDENQNLIFESAFALRELGSQSAIQKLLPLLGHQNQRLVIASLFVLGKLGNEEILPDLQQVLKYTDESIREQAVETLGELGSNTALLDLHEALKDSSSRVREKAIEALGKLGDESVLPELIKIAVEDYAISVEAISLRWTSAKVLGQINPEKASEELFKVLKDEENDEIRQNAAEALGKVGSETAIEPLIAALQDISIAWKVAKALLEIGSKKAVPGLIKALEHSVPCEQAAFALGEIGDDLAVPALINALNHWYPQVREQAVEALGNISDRKAIPKLYELYETLQKDSRNDLKRKVVIALGKLGDGRVRQELLRILDTQVFGSTLYRYDWWKVFEALEKIGDNSVILALIQVLLRAQNPQNRWKAAEALGNLGDEAAIDSLFKALEDNNSTVQWKSAEALGKFKSQQLIPKIFSLLAHQEEPNIRQAAVQVLGYLEDEFAVTALLEALNDLEPIVRYDVAQSLVKLSSSKVKLSVSKALGHFWKSKLLNDGFLHQVRSLKENCKFYNYEIWHEAMQNSNLELKNAEQGTEVGQTTTIFNIKTLNAPNAALNLGGTIHGDQTGTQRHPPKS